MNLPNFSFWILKRISPKHDLHNLVANFEELYRDILKDRGRVYAQLWIWGQIIKSLPGLFSASFFWRFNMFKNYIKTAIRNLKRNKTYSFLNLLGLAVGMAAFILILLYVQYELSFDRYHQHADQIYRIAWELPPWHTHSGKTTATGSFAQLGPTLVRECPEVISAIRIKKDSETLLSFKDNKFIESNIYFTDPQIFDIFSFSLVKGNPKTALNHPNSIIISEKMVKKYFGEGEPIGKIIKYSTSSALKVTGVLKNIPGNSHFIMDFVIPFEKYTQLSGLDLNNWNYRICLTYILLSKDADPAELLKKIHVLYEKYRPDDLASGIVRKHFLQSITKIHLYSNCDGELGVNNSIKNIYIFITIAFLILIIACINYMNLATARSGHRGKEVGVRKVVGAQRRQLIQQFLGESTVLTLLAFILSIVIISFVLPVFNSFIEKDIFINISIGFQYLLWLIPVVVFVIIFAGGYPALFISSYPPVSVLKGSFEGSSPGRRLRSILVVLQFSISIVLIFGALVIKTQLSFVRNADVGYNKDQIVVIRTNKESSQKLESIKTELKRNPNILVVSSSTYLPSDINDHSSLDWSGRPKDFTNLDIYMNIVDYDFVNLYDINVIKGRNFSKDFLDDANGAFIFNEALVKTLGWESPIGREVIRPRFREKSIKGKVVGVVKNFNFHSLHRDIQPLYLFLGPTERQYRLSVKLKGKNIPVTIEFLERKMKEFAPSFPFEYRFFDEIFDIAYKSEQKLGVMFNSFSLLAIFIASLGLFGLAAFTAEQKTKEIGIRKVLGAKMTGIVALLSKEFSKWVILANLFAWPVAWYVMHRWLQKFAFRIALELWIFGLSAGIVLVIALLTVIFQALKAANANPVHSLKYE